MEAEPPIPELHDLLAARLDEHPMLGTARLAVGPVERLDSQRLRAVTRADHRSAEELLPGARSVLAFFVPFRGEVVQAARRAAPEVSPVWARAYLAGNQAVAELGQAVVEWATSRGSRAAAAPATGDYDPESLSSRWSHRHVAVALGLGRLGRHGLLITAAGCAGRLGTLVSDLELPAWAPAMPRGCRWLCGSQAPCRLACPVGALPGLDGSVNRRACHARLRANARSLAPLPEAEVCGVCCLARCGRPVATEACERSRDGRAGREAGAQHDGGVQAGSDLCGVVRRQRVI